MWCGSRNGVTFTNVTVDDPQQPPVNSKFLRNFFSRFLLLSVFGISLLVIYVCVNELLNSIPLLSRLRMLDMGM